MLQSLFHYTTINNLALILKSKSIRFGRLDKVNDPMEGLSSDFNSCAHYLFVSSWTHNAEENFALWNMYTPKMRGVRIELSLPIFNGYKINDTENYLIPGGQIVDKEKNLFFLPGINEPFKIEYTDENEKLNPKIRTDIGLKLSALGCCKRKIWSFEDEYRFRMEIFPVDPNVKSNHFPDKYEHLIEREQPPSIDGHLVPISESSFNKMKVVTGPKIESGDFEIISALLNLYNPQAQLNASNLTGYVK